MGTPASQQNTQLRRWNWDRLNLIVILFCSLGILVLGIILLHETLSAHLASFSDWEGFISALASIGGMIGTYGQWLFPSPNIKKGWQRVIEWFQENTLTNPTASSPARWNVPPEQHVIGQQQILREIKEAYNSASHTKVVVGGISGAGKSMVALKYTYGSNYEAVLWITASSIEEIQESCHVIDSELTKPINKQVATGGHTQPHVLHPTSFDPQVAVAAVINWLKDNSDWLLVLDGYSDPTILDDDHNNRTIYSQMLKDFLSLQVDANRHILVTTDLSRSNFTSFHYLPIRIMEDNDGEDAASLFLYYYHGNEQSDNDNDRKIAKEIAKELGYLPLALACSGMFCSQSRLLSRFLDDYRENPKSFFAYSLTSPVANKTMKANWQKAYDYVHQKKHANDAAPLLKLCAFFAPELIPEELLCLALSQAIQQNTIEKLQKFSLLELSNNADNKRMFSIHTALQHAIRTGIYETDGMNNTALRNIASSAVRAINTKLPEINSNLQEIDNANWHIYLGYLPHAYACCRHILKLHDVVSLSEAVQLLYKTGCFLTLRAEFTGAEELLNKALEIIQQQPSPDSKQPHLAEIKLALGKLSYAQGMFSVADTHYKEAMKASPEPNERAAILIQQGLLHDDLCNDAQAAESYKAARKALGTRVINPPSDAILLNAILLNNEALLKMKPRQTQSQNRGATQDNYDYKGAEDNLWKALSLLKDEHPYTLECKANLATLFILQEKIPDKDMKRVTSQDGQELVMDAEEFYTQAASIGKGTLGCDRPQDANHINNLAIFYYLQGKAKKVSNKLEEADKFFKMARDAFQRAEQIYNNICLMHPMHAIIERNYATLLKNNIDADNEHDLIEQIEQNAEKIEQDYRKINSSLFIEQNNYKKNTGLAEQPGTQCKNTALTEQQSNV